MNVNNEYQWLLATILHDGDRVTTRNHDCISDIDGIGASFDDFPLVTLRKTAWKKAIREMEWFMSGVTKCPDELLDWWDGQLDLDGHYHGGYSRQMRWFSNKFDQVFFVLNAIKNHPYSRRIIMTTWNPIDMDLITFYNKNPNTPTCCHGTETQFFVRNGKLSIHTYQRSADMLLGVPHNWVQYWALLLFFAHHSGLGVGKLVWTFGDAHIYDDPTHLDCANEILNGVPSKDKPELIYKYSGEVDHVGLPAFKASDFSVVGTIPKPVTTIKPKLF
jgi:thymidylate synthase